MNERYWIALNGPSCAISAMPWRNPLVTPTPEQILGFPTLEEAQRAQRICLSAPIGEVKRFFKSLAADMRSGRVRVIQPPHPQPPTQGDTVWVEDEEIHAAVQQAFIKTTAN